MKKIGILFLAVGLMGLTGLAAEAAAPVSRTLEFRKEMMEWRSYAGVWEERHYDETLTLSFASNGWGVFDYRGQMLPFAWKADGKGNIEGYDKKSGGRKVFDVTYVPDEDVMDCGFGTNKSQLGFTGRCAFKSEKLSDEVVRLLTEVQRPAPLSGLDPLARIHFRELMKELRAAGKSIFFSSHELGETELLCDKVAIMKKGHCFYQGPVKQLTGEGEKNLERLFLDVLEKGEVK